MKLTVFEYPAQTLCKQYKIVNNDNNNIIIMR